jgi:chemotaxis response regulator CheB
LDSEQQFAGQTPQEIPEELPEVDSSEETVLPTSDDNLIVIGLGASAGGLVALRAFLTAVPTDTGMTFVVIVHLSPEHESVMAELLQGYTLMPVQQVQAHVKMEPNHVYVIPPGKRLLVTMVRWSSSLSKSKAV